MDLSKLSPEQQDFMNKVNTMVDKVNKNDSIACDTDCQRSRKLQELSDIYERAKNEVTTAPHDLLVAERNYLTFKDGEIKYNQIMKKRYDKQADAIISSLSKKYVNEYEEIESLIKPIKHQQRMGGYIDDLANNYKAKTSLLDNDVENTQSDINISNRESYYFNDYNNLMEGIYTWFNRLFILLTIIYIASVFMARKISIPHYRNISILMVVILLIPVKKIMFYFFK